MYEDEDEVEVNIRTENYLGHFFREDFLCHFELDKLTKTLPATFSTNEIEEWINGCIKEAINNFNSYIVADLEDDNEIYLEVGEIYDSEYSFSSLFSLKFDDDELGSYFVDWHYKEESSS